MTEGMRLEKLVDRNGKGQGQMSNRETEKMNEVGCLAFGKEDPQAWLYCSCVSLQRHSPFL